MNVHEVGDTPVVVAVAVPLVLFLVPVPFLDHVLVANTADAKAEEAMAHVNDASEEENETTGAAVENEKISEVAVAAGQGDVVVFHYDLEGAPEVAVEVRKDYYDVVAVVTAVDDLVLVVAAVVGLYHRKESPEGALRHSS